MLPRFTTMSPTRLSLAYSCVILASPPVPSQCLMRPTQLVVDSRRGGRRHTRGVLPQQICVDALGFHPGALRRCKL